MKYSQLPVSTSKTVSQDLARNARLLIQAGFIHQEMAGVYTFLPLGLRVLNKIENIIREEMDKIGVEIAMPALHPLENWMKTKRLGTVDVLMKTQPANEYARLKNDAAYVLGSTHEEIVTPMSMEFNKSYKDFPFAFYQIATKFRNEPRAKSGLLRCREFRMKDLYSFHTSEEDLKRYYAKAKDAYWRIFEKLGIGEHTTFYTLASGGDFTKDFSHEFQTVCSAGEDILFHVKSLNLTYNREVAPSMAPIIDDSKKEEKPRKDVLGEGIIGVAELCKFLGITEEETTKTLLFENEKGEIIAAAVRGGYDINEEKLLKVSGSQTVHLASAQTVKKVTGAEVGYAGLLNLPESVRVFMDESMKGRKNFEMGANKTHYHAINVNFGADLPTPKEFYDIKTAKDGDLYPQTQEYYEVYKSAEVGNIFPLNTKFTQAFGYTFTDEDGKQKPIYMGCYGIGPSRVMGVLVEKFADDKGLLWSANVAPFIAHFISLNVNEHAQKVYETLLQAGIEVFYDDRDATAGQKFADADLMGMPIRLVMSAKTAGKIEWKKTREETSELISVDELVKRLKE